MMGAARPEVGAATCPNCGRTDIKRMVHEDRVDRILLVPWSLLQQWLGGTLYGCKFCRVQFFDCRGHRSNSLTKSKATG